MKSKLTIAETITKLEDGFGSIYSKDDVLLMLNNLELNETKVESSITKSDLRILKNAIVETINKNREDICTIDDIELSINYHKSIEIDDITFDECALENLVADCVDEFIDLHNIKESEKEIEEESEEESEE